jgi:hypothetical protein
LPRLGVEDDVAESDEAVAGGLKEMGIGSELRVALIWLVGVTMKPFA